MSTQDERTTTLTPYFKRLVAIIDRSVRDALDAADERARERGVCWACGRPLPPDDDPPSTE
jgi:hypothetical protein